jgi:hypothetical protein
LLLPDIHFVGRNIIFAISTLYLVEIKESIVPGVEEVVNR